MRWRYRPVQVAELDIPPPPEVRVPSEHIFGALRRAMQKFQLLNKAIIATEAHYKVHDRKISICDVLKEFRNSDDYFTSICNQDILIEETLNQQLQTLIVDSLANIAHATKEDIKLFLHCLNGHIAKLEYRRSYLTIFLAMLALPLAVWAINDLPESALFTALIVTSALPLWLVILHIEQRISLLKRAAEHLRFMTE